MGIQGICCEQFMDAPTKDPNVTYSSFPSRSCTQDTSREACISWDNNRWRFFKNVKSMVACWKACKTTTGSSFLGFADVETVVGTSAEGQLLTSASSALGLISVPVLVIPLLWPFALG